MALAAGEVGAALGEGMIVTVFKPADEFIGVGEDGAEGVIPLEGRRKMAPFADEIASRVSAEVGPPAGNTCNVFIDGAHVNDSEEINDAVRDFLLRLSEIGAI